MSSKINRSIHRKCCLGQGWGDDACGEAKGVADHMEVIADLNNESYFTSWTSQEPPVRRQRIEGTEKAQALDEITDERIDGDHALGFEFAKGGTNRPAIGAGRT